MHFCENILIPLSGNRKYLLKRDRRIQTTSISKQSGLFFEVPAMQTNFGDYFPSSGNSTVYLDIETTGLDRHIDITTIALYDGQEIKTYVQGQNLDDFIEEIQRYKVIVRYNGKSVLMFRFIEHLFQYPTRTMPK